MKTAIYLDYNATTPCCPEAALAMQSCLSGNFGNPSSAHSHGQLARRALDKARQQLAELLGALPEEIVFTASGTEADNLALAGFAAKASQQFSRKIHLITSSVEHNAILSACKALEGRGVEITRLPGDAQGRVDPSSLLSAIKPETALVSIMLANNETGAIQPISEIAKILKERGITFHTDAVQALGRLPLSVAELGVDMLSISAHKVYAPKGAGAVWVRRGVRLEPIVYGGGQERGLRAGTENVPGIVAFGEASALAFRRIKETAAHEAEMRKRLENGIIERIPEIRVNGDSVPRLPNTLNLSFLGIEADALLARLDMAGVSVSTGSACSSGAASASHVLKAMGLPAERAYSALRFSVGRYSTAEEIDAALSILVRIVGEMRAGR